MKKIPFLRFTISLFLVAILSKNVFAQQTRRHFQADYDAKTLRFGYFLGLTNTYFNVKFNNYFVNKDNYYSITSPPVLGLKMGGLANFRLNDYFDFRVLPTVAIYGRRLEYKYIDMALPDSDPNKFKENTELRETAWFELPMMFKYKSERRGNVRMYVFGGLRYAVETNAVNRRRRQQFVTKTNDFSVEYGTGIEFFREYFKFSPEIHFSHGLNNLVDPVNNRNTPLQGVDRLTTHTVTLYILFE
ncbi:porin family protein [Emticicia sp. W12TSBA100-4]|uniref:type IX secretion/gliding motility protein PorT/SprT n=1 Tax=Emticicia sp. W12TSBA100-4 TaxID=3160965 RepID=UPI0033060CE0